MAIALRVLMTLGIVLVLFSVVSGMGHEGTKPLYSQYLMTAGLISLGLWVAGGLLIGFFTKDPTKEIEQQLKKKE